MDFTYEQTKALDFLKMAKVTYHKDMWKKNHELGYNTPGKPYDMIHIAADCPTKDVKSITLVHEVGHTYFNHVRINVKKEIIAINKLFKAHDLDYKYIKVLGGPMSFLNICMDLEVNSKLLTVSNLEHMKENVGALCTLEQFNVDYQDSFRDYYEPLIEYLKTRIEEAKEEARREKEAREAAQALMDAMDDDSDGDSDSASGSGDFDMDSDSGSGSGSFDSDDSDDDCSDEDLDEEGFGDADNEDYEDSEDSDDSSDNGESDEETDDDKDSFDRNIPSFEDIEDMLKNMAHDIVDSVSSFDEDLDEEVKKALQEEGYESAEQEQSATNGGFESKNTSDSNKTVGDEANDMAGYQMIDSSIGRGPGDGGNGSVNLATEVKDNNARNIKSFLQKIVRVSVDSYRLDYLKNLNRGTRENSEGILYPSYRSNMTLNKDKLGVLIDVSGSMDTSTIIEALKAIKDEARRLNPDSVVVTWNDSKKQEFPLTKIDDEIKIGGGTAMDRGLAYLAQEKKCSSILIYSDFDTDAVSLLLEAKKFKGNLYSIFVDYDAHNNYYDYESLHKDYIKLNKKVLRLH